MSKRASSKTAAIEKRPGEKSLGERSYQSKILSKDWRPWFVSVVRGEQGASDDERGVTSMLKGICAGLACVAAAGALALGCATTPAVAVTGDVSASEVAGRCLEGDATCRNFVDRDGDGVCDDCGLVPFLEGSGHHGVRELGHGRCYGADSHRGSGSCHERARRCW